MKNLVFLLFTIMPTASFAATYNSVPGAPIAVCNPDLPSQCLSPNSDGSINIGTGSIVTAADPNNASFQSAGTAVASGTLPLPPGMPVGKTARGVQYNCSTGPTTGSFTTLTLSSGGTLPFYVSANFGAYEGVSATSVTAVSGCTFQALY